MIQWTTAGAVSSPVGVQIRVSPSFPGRLAAGAPVAGRDLSPQEVLANARHFVVDRVGPRVPACTRVVLSGLPRSGEWAHTLAAIKSLGDIRLIWHRSAGDVHEDLVHLVDTVVRALRQPTSWRSAPDVLVVPLDHASVLSIGPLIDCLLGYPAARVVLQWPLSGPVLPASATSAAVAARMAAQALEGRDVTVSGLPPCVLATNGASWGGLTRRSSNRWYVDAEHQLGEALRFVPDLVRYHKPESCRFCSASHRCDGVPAQWYDLGLSGPLTPLGDGPSAFG